MQGSEDSSALSAFASARAKVLLLGSIAPQIVGLLNQDRSLNLEHVSPALLVQQEISRRTSLGQQAEQALKRGSAVSEQFQIALMRKWFWARKPDAGFLLEGFPATMLQALVFDEWLETRGETLTAVLVVDGCYTDPVATHYRTQGLLRRVHHATAA